MRRPEGAYFFLLHISIISNIFYSSGTLQTTQAQFKSAFGWGLTKRIENHGLSKFKANIEKVGSLFQSFFHI